ncbi:MAG TPA: energy transducer TonB [Chthoniobacterales bacterium]|nr:energy transducer TonB [Chthoniobacterales bacterium]
MMTTSLTAILRVSLVSCFFCLSFPSYAARDIVIPPSPLLSKTGDVQRFYGQVKAIDGSARTITIELGARFVVRVQKATKITLRGGAAATFDNITTGAGVDVVARRGAGNTWTALQITLERGAHFPDVISAKTVKGRTITGPEVMNLITYEPPSETVNRHIDFGHGSGLFLLLLRPDGTVANARPIKSTGVKELDDRAINRLMKMKFQPGALAEVRVPVSFFSFRSY